MNSLAPRHSFEPQAEIRFAGLRFHALTLDAAVAAVAGRPLTPHTSKASRASTFRP